MSNEIKTKKKLFFYKFRFIGIDVSNDNDSNTAWPMNGIAHGREEIKILAQFIYENTRDKSDRGLATAVNKFIKHNIRYDGKYKNNWLNPSVNQVLFYKRGVCTEFSILAVNLLYHMKIRANLLSYDMRSCNAEHMIFSVNGRYYDPTRGTSSKSPRDCANIHYEYAPHIF